MLNKKCPIPNYCDNFFLLTPAFKPVLYKWLIGFSHQFFLRYYKLKAKAE